MVKKYDPKNVKLFIDGVEIEGASCIEITEKKEKMNWPLLKYKARLAICKVLRHPMRKNKGGYGWTCLCGRNGKLEMMLKKTEVAGEQAPHP